MNIGTFGWYVVLGFTAQLVGRLFWGLTAPSDSISVYIERGVPKLGGVGAGLLI